MRGAFEPPSIESPEVAWILLMDIALDDNKKA
jgi:hypothetical protein